MDNMEYKKRLVKTLQQTDLEKRNVVYHGVALGLATYYVNKSEGKEFGDVYLKAEDMLYKINDLAIIDIVKLKNIVKNMIKFKMMQNDYKRLVRTNFMSLQAALGVEEIFDASILDIVENNADLFNQSINDIIMYLDTK